MTGATASLFQPLRLGAYQLQHRIVLPPLTRMRADEPHNAPGPLNAEYYAQRASPGGLLIGEATWVEPTGKPYPRAPGIQTEAQIEGWRGVAEAVHSRGGVIFLQLWHAGRIAHASTQPGGRAPVAPSAIAANGQIPDRSGAFVPLETPRALTLPEIGELIDAFAQGARNARAAGLDGVEIHAASGYLLEQFLHSCANRRADAYGGSLANRARLIVEVCEAVAAAIGSDRTGVRISPYGVAGDMQQDEPMQVYPDLLERLAPLGLAYLHVIEPRASGVGAAEVNWLDQPQASALLRPLWPRVLIASGGYKPETAAAAVAAGSADAIGFGRFFISNPDLPERVRQAWPLAPYHRPTFYTPGPTGYVDYPRASLDAAAG